MLLQLKQIEVPSGQTIRLHEISWEAFENILTELDEGRLLRVAYDSGILEIMNPLPEHEADKEIIGDLLKALLEELEIEFLTLGSTTFKNEKMLKGIEPDQCFYIQNEARVRGKKRLDLEIDPPPDLALEVDITARTYPETYADLGVPELWRRRGDRIQIYCLHEGTYVESEISPAIGNLPLAKIIPEFVNRSRSEGRNKAVKTFRQCARNL